MNIFNFREMREERDKLIAAAYAGDASVKEIATHFGMSVAAIGQIGRAAGITRKRGPKAKESPFKSRNQEIAADYLSGKTLEQVGQKFGITGERVRQILSRNGIEERLNGFFTERRVEARIAKAERDERSRARRERIAGERAQVRAMYNDGATYQEIADVMNRSIGWVTQSVWATGGPSRNAAAGRPAFRVSDEARAEIFRLYEAGARIQDIAAKFGIMPLTCRNIASGMGAKRPITRLREQRKAR